MIIFDLIHFDVRGPFQVPSYDEKRYFVIFIDDFNNHTYLLFLRQKNETFPTVTKFKATMETTIGRKIKVVQSD